MVLCRLLQLGKCSLMRNIPKTRKNSWILQTKEVRRKGESESYLQLHKGRVVPLVGSFSQQKKGRADSREKRMEEFLNCCCFLAAQDSTKAQHCEPSYISTSKTLARIFTLHNMYTCRSQNPLIFILQIYVILF